MRIEGGVQAEGESHRVMGGCAPIFSIPLMGGCAPHVLNPSHRLYPSAAAQVAQQQREEAAQVLAAKVGVIIN